MGTLLHICVSLWGNVQRVHTSRCECHVLVHLTPVVLQRPTVCSLTLSVSTHPGEYSAWNIFRFFKVFFNSNSQASFNMKINFGRGPTAHPNVTVYDVYIPRREEEVSPSVTVGTLLISLKTLILTGGNTCLKMPKHLKKGKCAVRLFWSSFILFLFLDFFFSGRALPGYTKWRRQ